MIDNDGYLITNLSIISEEIEDFQYSPKPEFECNFHIFNEKDKESLLKCFVIHCKKTRPNIFVTFNEDYFDIPFIGDRIKVNIPWERFRYLKYNIIIRTRRRRIHTIHIDCLY